MIGSRSTLMLMNFDVAAIASTSGGRSVTNTATPSESGRPPGVHRLIDELPTGRHRANVPRRRDPRVESVGRRPAVRYYHEHRN